MIASILCITLFLQAIAVQALVGTAVVDSLGGSYSLASIGGFPGYRGVYGGFHGGYPGIGYGTSKSYTPYPGYGLTQKYAGGYGHYGQNQGYGYGQHQGYGPYQVPSYSPYNIPGLQPYSGYGSYPAQSQQPYQGYGQYNPYHTHGLYDGTELYHPHSLPMSYMIPGI